MAITIVRAFVKLMLFHYRVEVWSHYWFHQLYTATVHRVGGFIANRSAFVFWVGVEFNAEAE